jgi:ABC-type nickel/cobalt efflux system permease component RcnA
MNTRSRTRTVVLAAAAAILVPAATLAHPLGNFTINHHNGLRVEPDRIVVDHVLDLAEIPTFSAFRDVDRDGDGVASEAERAAAAQDRCTDQAAGLALTIGGVAAPLAVTGSAVSFPMGQGAPTMRLVCRLEAAVPDGVAGPATFRDVTFGERAGWREVVVAGDRMTIRGDVAAASPSQRLTAYPDGLLAQAPDERAVSFAVVAGGPALPPLVQPELDTLTADPIAAAGDLAAAVPGGGTELSVELTALFQADELTPWVLVLSMLAAAGLGVLHALSPGHGKTVMAAYLVGSRGTARQAVGLGATVTASHTLGVLVLGLVSLSASTIIAPERLYPILGVVSGGIVISIAGWLLLGVVRRWWSARAAERAHVAAHAHGRDHTHPHDHGAAGHHGHDHATHDGQHRHGHAHAHAAADHRDHAPDAAGWHSHGGIRHTHLPASAEPLRWRGLFALGLAGGMVPSVSAIILLLGSIAAGRPAYGIALTIAFGAGMALVLVGIGVGLVHARGLLERLPSRLPGRSVGHLLPAGSAAVMLVAGVLITAQAALTLR